LNNRNNFGISRRKATFYPSPCLFKIEETRRIHLPSQNGTLTVTKPDSFIFLISCRPLIARPVTFWHFIGVAQPVIGFCPQNKNWEN